MRLEARAQQSGHDEHDDEHDPKDDRQRDAPVALQALGLLSVVKTRGIGDVAQLAVGPREPRLARALATADATDAS